MTAQEIVLGFISFLICLVGILLIIAELVLMIALINRHGAVTGFMILVGINLMLWFAVSLAAAWVAPEYFL